MADLKNLALSVEGTSADERKQGFVERRSEQRFWCSDLVQVHVKEGGRWKRVGVGVLEDISHSGACVQLELPLRQGSTIRLKHPQWKAEGEIRYCLYREIGYFVGLQFAEQWKWTEAKFKPKHLLDPRTIGLKKKQARNQA